MRIKKVDNGKQYRGVLEKYFQRHDIKLEKTFPKTPQINGVAEKIKQRLKKKR